MIFFVAPVDETWEMEEYLKQYGNHLLNRVTFITYDKIASGRALPVGTYIFSAIDRLFPCEKEIAARCCRELSGVSSSVTLINNPGEVHCRYEMLKKSFVLKRNTFRVFRAHEFHRCSKFPVFIRPEGEHTGSLTRLLYKRRDLAEELARALLSGYRLRDLMIVEYCNTADVSGVFRLYCATIVGDRIIPQVVVHNRDWITKWEGRLVDEETAREQENYVDSNPHAAWLKEIFELARIKYGRIDYGLVGGVPQVWEINTNPTIVRRVGTVTGLTEKQESLLAPVRSRFLQQFGAALEKIDSPVDPNRVVRVVLSRGERRQLEAEKRLKSRVRSRTTAISQMRPIVTALYRGLLGQP
jgi:hypothetical protein